MQPPSDTMRQTLQKLAEVRASRNATSTTAPPPYTLSVHRPTGMSVMSLDQSDESDPLYEEEPLSPITIHIDNSITVTGNNNTIVLSSGASSPTNPTNPENRNSSRLSSLATVIIAALNRANALRDVSGVPRPVNIKVNSAIRMDGNNNTIPQAGVPKPKPEYVDAGVGDDIAQKRRASSVRAVS